ncbi:MAG TPA: DUF4215 domain-containing protein [bacterium]|nr:DUF4215 domain-containing protein [bacterium]
MKTIPLVLIVALASLAGGTAEAAHLVVDDATQVVSGLGSGAFDTDGDGSLSGSEVSANDKCDNETECGVDSASCASPDGLPDGNHDCKCQLSEAIVAANSDLPVDSCKPQDATPFGEPDVVELEADGPYAFAKIDNVGNNTAFDLGNGPNALPKIKSFVIIEGNGNLLERVCPAAPPPPPETQPIEAVLAPAEASISTRASTIPPPCKFRLLETDSFLEVKDLTARNFDPDCLDELCASNTACTPREECFNGGFLYVAGGFADLSDVVATGNQTSMTARTRGGAVYIEGGDSTDVSIHESILSNNKSHFGGAIAADAGSILTIDQTTIRQNQALLLECVADDDDVGGMCDCDGICDENEDGEGNNCADCALTEGLGWGGGIGAASSQVTLFESSIHDNRADQLGGGIFVFDFGEGSRQKDGSLVSIVEMINTTVANNLAQIGAGIAYLSLPIKSDVSPSSHFDILNNTIAGNGNDDAESGPVAEFGGGIFKLFDTAPMTLRNTIVAGNIAADGADGHGLFTSGGHNHVGDSSGFFMSPISGDLYDQPAGLDAWVDDSPTDVTTAGTGHFPLQAASLNVDSADGTGCPSIDQIQVNRDEDRDFLMEFEECSKGAIEYNDVCGDGRVEVNNGETCDDGNAVDGDGCSANCASEVCGDGTVQLAEECDDGNTESGDGCEADCTVTTTPEGAICGNGTVEGGEECDNGEGLNDDTVPNACRQNCTNPVCGDGVIDTEFGEECDGEAGCLVGCSFEAIAGCNITLVDATTLPYKGLLEKYGFDSIVQCSQIGGGGASGLEKVSFESLQARGINAGCSLIRE